MHKRTNKYFDKSQPELQNFSNNDQNREEDTTMTEEDEAEAKEWIADMQEKQNFIDSIARYSKAYEPIISTSKKAIIILGQNKEDAYIISNFLKKGQVETKGNRYDHWEYVTEIKDNLSTIAPHNIEKPIIYNSDYLNNNSSPFSEFAFDTVFLQKILSTLHTKFILTIKDIKIKSDTSPNKAIKIKELSNIFKKFISLLENIDIKVGSLSLVVTDVPLEKKKDTITSIIEEAITESNFDSKQMKIINELKNSVYTFPKAAKTIERVIQFNKLSNILKEEKYITLSDNNKITVLATNSDYITNAVKVIKDQIEIIIDELKTPIKTEWDREKVSVFKTIEDQLVSKPLPTTGNLLNIINIIKEYKTADTNKTIENFIKIVRGVKSILPDSEKPHKLENLLNDLKHFSNIKLDAHENIKITEDPSWFNDLLSKFKKVNIEKELLVAFKDMLRKDENSFFNILKKNIQTLYQNIENNKILNSEEILKIDKLKSFLINIKNSTAYIKNFNDIKSIITYNLKNLPNASSYLTLNLDGIINNLKALISLDELGIKSLWSDIIKFIPEIDINKVIYNKLLHSEILPNQDSYTYLLLEDLLITTHQSISFRDQQKELYNFRLAEIYCKQAENANSNDAIASYKKAAELGSITANINLGKIYFQNKNDEAKGVEYLRKTTCISTEEQVFTKFISEKEAKPHNNDELAQDYLLQAEYYLENDLMDDAKKAYLNAIGKLTEKLEPKYYPKLSEIYSQLAEIASNSNKSKFLIKSKEYNILALKTGHTCTDLNALTPTPVKEKKVETTNTTTPLIPYNDLAWDNNLQILGNNLDGSGCLEPYKS